MGITGIYPRASPEPKNELMFVSFRGQPRRLGGQAAGYSPDFTCAPFGNESELSFHSLHLVIRDFTALTKWLYSAILYFVVFILSSVEAAL
jgi:hypothetical protein